jgi:hypothetical protein
MIMRQFAPGICLAIFAIEIVSVIACHGHNEYVHCAITESAFTNSSGLLTFLANNLGADNAPFTAGPDLIEKGALFFPDTVGTPYEWLVNGSYYEDMQTYGPYELPLRLVDHFYTVTPQRNPGQVQGLTDNTEGPFVSEKTGRGYKVLPGSITNSYAWGAWRGGLGPGLGALGNVGSNLWAWQNARDFEFAALTNSADSDPIANWHSCFLHWVMFCI